MHDTKEYTLRFRAFAASRNQSPEDAPATWEFIVWIRRQWREYRAERRLPDCSITDAMHADFDAWLNERYGVTA